MIRCTRYGIQILSNCGKAKICDARTTRAIHEDIWLTGSHYGDKIGYRNTTHSLEVPMNHIARVEVAQAFSDIGKLAMGSAWDENNGRDTYKSKSVCVRVLLDVFLQVPPRHPV